MQYADVIGRVGISQKAPSSQNWYLSKLYGYGIPATATTVTEAVGNSLFQPFHMLTGFS
jgi:hypothetical protein